MEAIENILNKRKWQPPQSNLNTLEGLPIRLPVKQTRLYLDNEYYEGGYAAMFPHSITTVYGWLARRAKQTTQICYPSAKDIMERCGITNRNTVFEALKLLEAYNIIFIVHRSKGHVPNVYALLDSTHWKPINSTNFDTVMQTMRRKRTVSNESVQQYQNQLSNSGTGETRSHITESNNKIKADLIKKKEESETDKKTETIKGEVLQRLSAATKSVVAPHFREEDIIATLVAFEESGMSAKDVGYKQLIEALLKSGAILKKELPSWINIRR
ncbi:MAG: helix-turn-helix domain-containing protein [Candidatus Yonathbacteria bacterium]|nr:helix-turn-helix domain-containing protein [Candidatus Yonathbacteria bacterium]